MKMNADTVNQPYSPKDIEIHRIYHIPYDNQKTVFNHVFLIYYILLGGLEENWIMTFHDFF